MTQQIDGCTAPCASRRAVLAAAGAAGVGVALTGCQAYDQSGGSQPPAPPPPAAQASAPTSPGAGASSPGAGASSPGAGQTAGGGGGPALAKTSEIPVGGGKVFGAQKVVVTQPQAGTFRAFSAVCTHQGCTVANVSGGTINCECHGSKYKVVDGSVANGPATKGLAARTITVDGEGSLRLG